MKNTTLCYLEDENHRYLMLHRVKKENDENRDKWIGIGGHIEEWESPHDCILREIREETGLSVLPGDCKYRGVISFCSPEYETEYMHLFHAKRYSGTLAKDCPEGVLEWIGRDRLLSLPMWEGDRIFLELLEKPVPFFSLKLCYGKDGVLLSHDLQMTGAEKKPLVISACLLGIPCRYDGQSKPMPKAKIEALRARYTLIPVCPEQLGGLPTPRVPSERRENGTVINRNGTDVTEEYRRGAEAALAITRICGADTALFKARSPSCGAGAIYDGTFRGTLKAGNGTAAVMLSGHGVRVYTEENMEELLA